MTPFGWATQIGFLESLGGEPNLRHLEGGEPFCTDQGNYILDTRFAPLEDPAPLAAEMSFVGLSVATPLHFLEAVRQQTQIPFLAQRDFNEALSSMGLAGRNTRVIVPALGGGFGTGLDTHCYEYIAILLSYYTRRPVKVEFDRAEEFKPLFGEDEPECSEEEHE